MEFNERPLIIVDLETTGLDPLYHEVLDIGALRVYQETLQIEKMFNCRIYPLHVERASPKALEVNGYSIAAWADCPIGAAVWPEFFRFAKDGVFCSYSTHFDWGFMREVIRTYYPQQEGVESREEYGPFDRHLIDIPSIAWGVLGPLPKIGKDPVALHLGLQTEPKPHNGLSGALHALSVLKKLRFGGRPHAQTA